MRGTPGLRDSTYLPSRNSVGLGRSRIYPCPGVVNFVRRSIFRRTRANSGVGYMRRGLAFPPHLTGGAGRWAGRVRYTEPLKRDGLDADKLLLDEDVVHLAAKSPW